MQSIVYFMIPEEDYYEQKTKNCLESDYPETLCGLVSYCIHSDIGCFKCDGSTCAGAFY